MGKEVLRKKLKKSQRSARDLTLIYALYELPTGTYIACQIEDPFVKTGLPAADAGLIFLRRHGEKRLIRCRSPPPPGFLKNYKRNSGGTQDE